MKALRIFYILIVLPVAYFSRDEQKFRCAEHLSCSEEQGTVTTECCLSDHSRIT